MERNDLQIITDIVARVLNIPYDNVGYSDHFRTDLKAHSFDHVEILSCVERHYQITIPSEKDDHLFSVEQIMKYLFPIKEVELEPTMLEQVDTLKAEPTTLQKEHWKLILHQAAVKCAINIQGSYAFPVSIKAFEEGAVWGVDNPPDRVINEEYKKMTGHSNIHEHIVYDKGREDEQTVILDWIKKWDGSTNSTLGQLLDTKMRELNIVSNVPKKNNKKDKIEETISSKDYGVIRLSAGTPKCWHGMLIDRKDNLHYNTGLHGHGQNPQHLYIVSDEKLNEGDWYIYNFSHLAQYKREGHKVLGITAYKIIASTAFTELPSISQTWIRDTYVPSNGKINKVKLEIMQTGYWFDPMPDGPVKKIIYGPKLTPNNEVIIVSEHNEPQSLEKVPANIDFMIEEWHTGDSTLPIYEYIGISKERYEKWVKDSE